MKRPLIIAFVYLIFGILWIYFSDRIVLSSWGSDAEALTRIQNLKGYLFVAISALLIGFLVKFSYDRIIKHLGQIDDLHEGSSMGVFKVDGEGRIVLSSRSVSGILGYPRVELKEINFQQLLTEEDRPAFKEILNDLRKGVEGKYLELKLTQQSGKHIPVRLNAIENRKGDADSDLFILIADLSKEKNAERERLKQLELFEQIFKNIPVLITIYDPEVKEVRVNREFEKVLGWTNEEIGKVNIMEKIYPDEALRKAAKEWMAQSNAGWKELELKTRDGKTRIQEWSNVRLSDDTVIGIGVDLTELKQKEKQIRQNKELYQGIFDTAQVGLCLTDRNGIFRMVNDEYAKLYGYEKHELLGEQITKLLPEEAHEEALEISRKIVDGEMDVAPTSWQVMNKQGDLLDIIVNVTVLNMGAERLQVTSVTDITEQKNIQRKLEQSEAMLKTAQKISKIGYWELNMETNELFWGEEVYDIWGVSPDEFEVNFDSFYNTIHPEDKPGFDEVQEKALTGEIELYFEHRILLSNGEEKWVLERGNLVKNEEGKPIKFEGAVEDITERKTTEEKIRFQAKMLDSVGQSVIATDVNGKVIYWNKVAEKLYLWKESEVMGRDILSVTPSEQSLAEAEEIMEKLRKGKSWSGEFLAKRKNGEEVPILVVNSPVTDVYGNLTAIIGVSVDISERKQREQEIFSLHQRLSAITNNLPGAVFQYSLFEDGSDAISYVSKGSRLLWELEPEEVVSDVTKVWRQVHPEDVDGLRKSISRSADAMELWNFEWRIVKPGGEVRWHQGLGTPRKANGAIVWDTLVLDITDRKEAELSLQEREEYLRILMDNASDGILASDAQGNILFYNDRLAEWVDIQKHGNKVEEWPEMYGLYNVEGSRHLRPEEIGLSMVLKHGEIRNYEYMIKGKDGKDRIVESNGSAMCNEKGEKIGAMVVIRDITQRLLQEELNTNAILEAIEKERGSIAHEIHDGLTQHLSISSMNLKNLVHDFPAIEKERKYQDALKYLTDSIEESRSISHRIMPPAIRDFGLIAAIEDLIESLNNSEEIEYTFEYNKEVRLPEPVEINLYRLVQEALQNVQIHAGADKVGVNISITSGKIYLRIKDDGVGFEKDRNRQMNSGIGLRTMRSRILKLKGTFEIRSKPNKGTIILVEVPLKTPIHE